MSWGKCPTPVCKSSDSSESCVVCTTLTERRRNLFFKPVALFVLLCVWLNSDGSGLRLVANREHRNDPLGFLKSEAFLEQISVLWRSPPLTGMKYKAHWSRLVSVNSCLSFQFPLQDLYRMFKRPDKCFDTCRFPNNSSSVLDSLFPCTQWLNKISRSKSYGPVLQW